MTPALLALLTVGFVAQTSIAGRTKDAHRLLLAAAEHLDDTALARGGVLERPVWFSSVDQEPPMVAVPFTWGPNERVRSALLFQLGRPVEVAALDLQLSRRVTVSVAHGAVLVLLAPTGRGESTTPGIDVLRSPDRGAVLLRSPSEGFFVVRYVPPTPRFRVPGAPANTFRHRR